MTYTQEQYDALLAVCRSYRQDVERLEKNMKSVIKTGQKQAVKEFAEKLKKKSFDKNLFIDWAGSTYVVLVKDIDELLKEYDE